MKPNQEFDGDDSSGAEETLVFERTEIRITRPSAPEGEAGTGSSSQGRSWTPGTSGGGDGGDPSQPTTGD